MDYNQVTEDGIHPLPEKDGGDLSAQENEICFQSPIHEESEPMSEVRPQSPVPKHAISLHVQDPMP